VGSPCHKPSESLNGSVFQDGLVHISAIAPGRVEKVSDYLDVGDKVWAKALMDFFPCRDPIKKYPKWPMVPTCARYIPTSYK